MGSSPMNIGAQLLHDALKTIEEANGHLIPMANMLGRTGNVEALRNFAAKLPATQSETHPCGFLRHQLQKLADDIEANRISRMQLQDLDFGRVLRPTESVPTQG